MAEIQVAERTIRCVSCGKVIAKGAMSEGVIEIRCKCGVDNRIEARQRPESRSLPGSYQSCSIGETHHELQRR